MHVVAFFVALGVAGTLWSDDRYGWAIVAFILIASGMWIWPLRLVGALLLQVFATPAKRREAREFRDVTKELGLFDALTAEQLRAIFYEWRKRGRLTGLTMKEFVHAELGIDDSETRVVSLDENITFYFYKSGDRVSFRCEGAPDPLPFFLPRMAISALTKQQLAAGEEPWFRDSQSGEGAAQGRLW